MRSHFLLEIKSGFVSFQVYKNVTKPQDSLTASNRDQFSWDLLTILGSILDAIVNAKKLILESIAQEFVQV